MAVSRNLFISGGLPLNGVDAGNVQYLSRPTDATRIEDISFLVLGKAPPVVPGLNFGFGADSRCAGIVLLDRIDAADLLVALADLPDPTVPIADFGNNGTLRRDFVGSTLDEASIADLKQQFAPIWLRLAALPFRAAPQDRAELATLRLAYSRNRPIEAMLASDSLSLVEYPLLGRGAGTRRRLELLAELDLLRRTHFTRTHGCGKCGSARLHVYEACPACGSAELIDEPIVHHYRCGWQDAESRFAKGRILTCPKCRRELRHFGVDYGKPGDVAVCRRCGEQNAEPIVNFSCLDCGTVTRAADVAVTDWYHYDLTDEGLQALHDGRLPRFDIGPLLEGRTRAFTAAEFRLLATEGMRVAQRYQRPFSVARFSIAEIDSLRNELGPVNLNAAFRLAVDAIVETLRESDFVGADGASSILAGFPETTAEKVAGIVDRIRSMIPKTVSVPLRLDVSIADGGAIADLLAQS
jgi:hypothetical protein